MTYGLCKIFVNNYKDRHVIRFCDGSFILIVEVDVVYVFMQDFSINCRNWYFYTVLC